MDRPYKQIEVERQGEIYVVRLRHTQLDESGLDDFSADIARLLDEDGCRKLIMILGPQDPLCLYSVFLAKLVNLQRRLAAAGGALVLAGLSETSQRIFQVAGLHKYFHICPDSDKAVEALSQ